MSTSENNKARAEARHAVSSGTSAGRYEEALARVLAGLAYAVTRVKPERQDAEHKAAEPGERGQST